MLIARFTLIATLSVSGWFSNIACCSDFAAVSTVGAGSILEPGQAASSESAEAWFSQRIAPLLIRRCLGCHQDGNPAGGLSLETVDDLQSLGVLDPDDLDSNHLIQLLTPVAGRAAMPQNADPLSADDLTAVRRWIELGGEWPAELRLDANQVADLNWWSLQPMQSVAAPLAIADAVADWPRNSLDQFILAKQATVGLKPSPPADRRTLLRRLHYDLVGLPPTQQQIDAFLADTDPYAYEKRVDELLSSPQYGERWARHWLDVVHYGDSHGYDKDQPRPHAWPYRDYVIRAFNDDRDYALFVRQQLAGDVLWPDSPDAITATGFLAAGPWDLIGHAEVLETKIDGMVARNLDRDDMVCSTFNTFLATAVQCARCHNHKFDPLTQADYYSLQAVFAGIDRTDRAYEPDPEIGLQRQTLVRQQQQLQSVLAELQTPLVDQAAVSRTQAQLDETTGALQALPPPAVVYAGTVHFGSGAFRGTHGVPRSIHLLERGEVTQPRDPMPPGTAPWLPGKPHRWDDLPADRDEGGRRARLADWIVDPENPLTWRTMVNRVWLYHFGRGLVDTPNDFGRMGETPTHPELLDWLAGRFRDERSIKQLQRLICTSATYRQSVSNDPDRQRIDSDNAYYWRQTRKRLDAESIRDSVLLLADKLDLAMGGPAFQDFVIEKPEHSPHYQYHLHDPDDVRSHRRSVYRFLVRSQTQPLMTTLDCADPSVAVPKRDQTLTPLQAMAMMNNPFLVRMSEHFAARLQREHDQLPQQIERGCQLAWNRQPTPQELQSLTRYAADHGLPNACRVLLNTHEFTFVE